VEQLGLSGVVIAIGVVFGVFLLSYFFGVKFLKMDRELSALTSCGSSICGAAAVLGAEATLNSRPYKTSAAIATVVVFGTIFMFALPLAYNLGAFEGVPQKEIGIFVGAVTHEVAQVVGASSAISNEAQIYAVIEKMMRVVMLVPLLFILPFLVGTKSEKSAKIPSFALYFLLAILINSLLPLPKEVLLVIEFIDLILLTMAMSALGVETSMDKLKTTGGKPFVLALFSAILLILFGILGIWAMGA